MPAPAKPFAPALKEAIEQYHGGDRDGALGELEALVQQYPQEAAVHGFLGGFLFLEGRYDSALPHVERAASLAPSKAVPARQLILTLIELNRYADARDEILRSKSHLTDSDHKAEWRELLDHVQEHVGTSSGDA